MAFRHTVAMNTPQTYPTQQPFAPRRRWFFAGIVLSVLAVAIVLILKINHSTLPQPESNLAFQLLNGTQTTLQAQQGNPLIVAFWATTCTPCMRKMADWEKLYQQNHQQGFNFIAVAMPYDNTEWIRHFAENLDWSFPVALDPSGDVAQAFGDVAVTPTTFLIAPDGIVQEKILGEVDFAMLQQQLSNGF